MVSNSIIVSFLLIYFILLVSVSAIVGKQKGNEAFFTADRKAPWFVVAIGMIGNSISGVSFVSVPGMVRENGFLYMQTVAGFFIGYILIAGILIPLYYKLDSPSIYSYLKKRFGVEAYKTGASFFLLSKGLGAAARIYVVVLILQTLVFNQIGIPFYLTTAVIIMIIWLYTSRSGIKTIIWTDLIQTTFMVAAMILIIVGLSRQLDLDFKGIFKTTVESKWFRLTEFSDWSSKQHFVKQFLSGIFIAFVMTGLDQDMMQKNRTIEKIGKAKVNLYTYGFAFLPVNFLFLITGVLMLTFAEKNGIVLPFSSDEILPTLVSSNSFGPFVTILFIFGVISATFSGADSAMTSMTTSFCVDIAGKKDDTGFRKKVHIIVALIFMALIIIFREINNKTLIDAIYTLASYTYGPLLGLFCFGMISKRKPSNKLIPYITVLSPVICYILGVSSKKILNYSFGYELLIINGLITYVGLFLISLKPFSANNKMKTEKTI